MNSQVEYCNKNKEILELLAQGKCFKEVGAILFKSPRTIEGRVQMMRFKTDTKTTAELIAWAFKNDIL
jgi:DNA-binding CsgD family transcriptional regulator